MADFLKALRNKGDKRADEYELAAVVVAFLNGVSNHLNLTVDEVILGLTRPPIPPGYDHFYWGKAA
jgi:hypothetical protein